MYMKNDLYFMEEILKIGGCGSLPNSNFLFFAHVANIHD